MLIAATSGRSLAQSAQRAGYAPLTADFFCDLDTRDAGDAEQVAGNFSDGFELKHLEKALTRLAARRSPIGLVYGSGFERDPGILLRLMQVWPLLGNDPVTVERVKDPIGFARMCASLDIPHPETQALRPGDRFGWLGKARGGSGGTHVTDAERGHPLPGHYYQRRVGGVPMSALFLADGSRAQVVGYSRQWASPTDGEAFRYGGAIRPAGVLATVEREMGLIVQRIVEATGLKGLNSADFLVDGSRYLLLEINPRPGATIDIFDDAEGWLFAAHIAACRGVLPASPVVFDDACAACVVYADIDIGKIPQINWPEWALDRQTAGSRVEAGAPLCTVTASAAEPTAAMNLLTEREEEMKRRLGGTKQ